MMLSQVLRRRQSATLQLTSDGPAIGRATRDADDVDRRLSTVSRSASRCSPSSGATRDASDATPPSVEDHRVTTAAADDADTASRDRVGPKPEVVAATARWVGGDTFRRERRRPGRRCASDLGRSRDADRLAVQSRDRNQLPAQRDAAAWWRRRPEALDRRQSGGSVATSTISDDAVSSGVLMPQRAGERYAMSATRSVVVVGSSSTAADRAVPAQYGSVAASPTGLGKQAAATRDAAGAAAVEDDDVSLRYGQLAIDHHHHSQLRRRRREQTERGSAEVGRIAARNVGAVVVAVRRESAAVSSPSARRPEVPPTTSDAASFGATARTADEGRATSTSQNAATVGAGSSSTADREPSARQGLAGSRSDGAAPRRVAGCRRSATAEVPTSSQIWWPCSAESDDERPSNGDSCDDDRASGKEDGAIAGTAATAADAAVAATNDDVSQMTSWTELDASVAESIRELDNFLLLQDSEPLYL